MSERVFSTLVERIGCDGGVVVDIFEAARRYICVVTVAVMAE